jgi:hypothetical protein
MRRGVRPKVVAEQVVAVDATNKNDWQPAVETLRGQVRNELWHDANASVVISDHWAKYAVVPWSPEVSSQEERKAYARLVLDDTYGDIADQWSISLSENRPRTATIVSAISTPLLEEIQTVLAQEKLRVISLQPHLVVAFNAWRDKIPDSAAWFASIDEGLLAALHLTDGHCDRVRSVRLSDDWAVEMKRIQTMARLAQGRPAEGRIFVDAPLWLRESADKSSAALEWLDGDRAPRNIVEKVSFLKGMYA